MCCVFQGMADQAPREVTSPPRMAGDESQEEDMCGSDSSFISNEHTDQLIDNIERLRLETGYTDLTICIEHQRFPCHKVGMNQHLSQGGHEPTLVTRWV